MERAKVYSETIAVLDILGKEFIKKLPKEMYNKILSEKSQYYNPKYDANLRLIQQNISKETSAFLSFLHYSYWCDNAEEKNRIKKILENNEKKFKESIKAEVKEELFTTSKIPEKETIESKELQVIEEKQSIFTKISNLIKRIIGRDDKINGGK